MTPLGWLGHKPQHKTTLFRLHQSQLQQTTFFFYFFLYFSEKTSLDISCESSAWQMIHMKCLSRLVISEKKKKNFECCLLQILLGASRRFTWNVKTCFLWKRKKKIFECLNVICYKFCLALLELIRWHVLQSGLSVPQRSVPMLRVKKVNCSKSSVKLTK